MCLSLCINRGPMANLNYHHYHQLILFNAAHQITTLLPVISNKTRAEGGGILPLPSTVSERLWRGAGTSRTR